MHNVGKPQDRNRKADTTGADFDTPRDSAFDRFLGRNARWQFSPKIPAFGTPHLGVRNFYRERIDHRIAILAHLIKHSLDLELHLAGPYAIHNDSL